MSVLVTIAFLATLGCIFIPKYRPWRLEFIWASVTLFMLIGVTNDPSSLKTLILASLILYGAVKWGQYKRRGLQAEEEERLLEQARVQARAADFESGLVATWPIRQSLHAPPNQDYLLMSADQTALRIVSANFNRESPIITDCIVHISDIVDSQIERESTTVTSMVTQTRTRSRNGIARAAVGELIAGPVGALVGATTAGSDSVGTMAGEQRTIYGASRLLITTTDPAKPLHKLDMPDYTPAEVWLHRIRGAMALSHRQVKPA